jgi:AraC family transcriptional regulator, glycine betaine-responsive activator
MIMRAAFRGGLFACRVTAISATQHFSFLLMTEFTHVAFFCALEPLRIATFVPGKPLCRRSLLSEDVRTDTCSDGSDTLTGGGMEPGRKVDRLFLILGPNV